jgi:ABC-type glycerol-3-phosphate transport system permease component
MINDWRFNPTEPLLILSKVIGDVVPDWAAEEELNQLRCFITFDSGITANLQLEHLFPLVQAYGDALFCQFQVGEQIVLDVDQQIDQEKLDNFHNAVAGIQQVTLDLRIDKSRLAVNWFSELFGTCQFPNRLFLYLFPARLELLLRNSNLSQLEEKLWKEHWGERVVFLIPDREVCIVGPYVLVIGGKFLQNPPAFIFNNQMKDEKELTRVYRECQEALKWQKPWVEHLTPWHLYPESLTSASDSIVNLLRLHFVNLFLLYTADRSTEKNKQPNDKSLISSYTTSQQALDVGFDKARESDIGAIPHNNFTALFHIFEWSYDDRWNANDRLPIVQIGIVEALKGATLSLRFKLLLENASTIFDNITWNWKAFIEGKIDAYADQVQNLEEQVGKIVNTYSEQISSIITSLTETMLAAIVVVLGSFIAALFQEKFNPVVFRIGLITYALYLVFFPLLYNMKNRWESIETIEKEFDTQKRRFKKRLPPDKVNSIIDESQIDNNKRRFKRWFWRTVVIYILVTVVLLIAAFTIPGYVQVAAVQPVTPTPTVIP